MYKINFDSEGLKVDYLGLNLQFHSLEQINKLADCLAKIFDCQSVLLDKATNQKHLLTKLNRNR